MLVRTTLPAMTVFALAALLLLPAGPAQAQIVVPTDPMLARYGLERVWWNQATTNPLRDVIQHIVLDEETVFVQSSSGIVTAFDSETGRRLWATQVGRQDDPTFPAATNDELAIIAIGVRLYGLVKRTGAIHWEYRLPSAPSTSPAVDEENVYVGGLDGSVHALNLRGLRDLYVGQRLPNWGYQATRWTYQSPAAIVAPAVSVKDTVSVASSSGNVYTMRRDSRKIIWIFETDAPSSAPLSSRGNFLYMPSEDFDLYCLDLGNGVVRWRFVAGSPIEEQAHVIGPDIFLTPTAGGMFSLSSETGARRWWRPGVNRFLAATPRIVYASDERDNLVFLQRSNGALLGALPLRGFPIRIRNDRTDRLYLATESGTVICIREQGQKFPIYHANPERRPILPEFAPETPAEQPAEDAVPMAGL